MHEAAAYREMVEYTSEALKARIEEVSAEKLHQRPGPGLNPVGWNYWHALRVWDLDLNWYIKGQDAHQDAWYRGEFSARSGYDPTGKGLRATGIGLGYSDAEVDELSVIDASVLYDYQRVLLEETLEYLETADDAELRRSIPNPRNPDAPMSVASRLQHLVTHTWNHIGELGYAKGMLGMHDQTYPGRD
jgi:hypothetical protein